VNVSGRTLPFALQADQCIELPAGYTCSQFGGTQISTITGPVCDIGTKRFITTAKTSLKLCHHYFLHSIYFVTANFFTQFISSLQLFRHHYNYFSHSKYFITTTISSLELFHHYKYFVTATILSLSMQLKEFNL
jgi:hypothetical protein